MRDLIRNGSRTEVVEQLKRWDPVDVMQLLTRLRLKHANKLFWWLPANPSIKFVAELRPEFRDILARLDPEDAVEILNDFPDDVVDELFERPEEA